MADHDHLGPGVELVEAFFLVDEVGVLRYEADRFLRRRLRAAKEAGLDPSCFKEEWASSIGSPLSLKCCPVPYEKPGEPDDEKRLRHR